MSKVSSANAIRAAVKTAWSDRVGGPFSGKGEPFVVTNRLRVADNDDQRLGRFEQVTGDEAMTHVRRIKLRQQTTSSFSLRRR